MLLDKIARLLLPWCISRLYSSDNSRNELIRQVNNETWIGSQIGSGGHSLRDCKPIGTEEVISILCVLRNDKTYVGDDAKFRKIDYYNSEWTE